MLSSPKHALRKKNRVNVKKRQLKFIGLKKSVNLPRKTEVQDRLDRILKIAYPFVSERKGWTDAETRITIEDDTVNIRVNPLFVPLGEDDEIKVAVGVLVDEDGDFPGFVYVWIWKEEGEIFVQHGNIQTPTPFDEDEEDTEIDIDVKLDTYHLMQSGQDYYGEEDEDSATDDDDYYPADDDDDEEDDDEDAFEELDDLLDVAGSLVSVIFAANGKNNFNIR